MKRIIRLFSSAFILLIVHVLFLGCKESLNQKNFSEKNKGGILMLEVEGYPSINTGASVYHKYKVEQISSNFIFLDSSDIGSYIFSKNTFDNWEKLYTRKIKICDLNIYIIFPNKTELLNGKEIYPYANILFQGRSQIKNTKINGIFYCANEYEQKYYKIVGNQFIINNGKEDVIFDINKLFNDN